MANDKRKSGPVVIRSEQGASRSVMTGQVVEVRGPDRTVETSFRSDRAMPSNKAAERVEAVMRGAANEGLTLAKDGRIAGRVSAELIAAAKARTGLQSDTELVEFALANVALKDDFAQVFRDVRRTVDPDLDLGF